MSSSAKKQKGALFVFIFIAIEILLYLVYMYMDIMIASDKVSVCSAPHISSITLSSCAL